MNRNDKEFIVTKIRTQYVEKEATEFDELRELDAAVKRPANLFAYIFGSISAVIMGSGMSLVMTELGATLGIESPMVPGIIIGAVGMAMALANYPIYKKLLRSRKEKYADEIIELSNNIINK